MPQSADRSGSRADVRHVLITQCLQNDLLLNRDCRLYIGDEAARNLLLGRHGQLPAHNEPRLRLGREAQDGPLGSFLRATIGARLRGKGRGMLHVINIRDWHISGETYDQERRAYGPHCEAGTWGARYLDCYERLLDPARSPRESEAQDFQCDGLFVHHVHSDSIFDFRPRRDERGKGPKFAPSQLERILDGLVEGTEADSSCDDPMPIYIAAIGVYSDIKVVTLLASLRTRYDLPNLAVSDTLTASASLERHIAGLDFVDKLLGVEVLHGVNSLCRFLGSDDAVENESDLVAADSFSRYRSFFQDKQSVLVSESERLRDYLTLTERRASETYSWIQFANRFLVAWGSVFLLATLAFAIAASAGAHVAWKLPAITGGIGIAQLLGAFYSRPMQDLQRNLTNLAVFKMILESRSLKTALGRFHLTTPQVLRELQTEDEAAKAKRQIDLLRTELAVIQEYDKTDFGALGGLGFGIARHAAETNGALPPVEAVAAPATNGGPPDASVPSEPEEAAPG
jgi:hypothetical protein